MICIAIGSTCSMGGEMRNAYKIFVGRPQNFGALRRSWRIVLKLVLNILVRRVWIGFVYLRVISNDGLP
jgi:hypothetical protein